MGCKILTHSVSVCAGGTEVVCGECFQCVCWIVDWMMLLQDLIKFTSTSHTDYDSLQKTLSIAQKYLFADDDTSEGSQACNISLSLSSLACRLMKCCRVDDASPECTITGFFPGWVDPSVNWLHIRIDPLQPGGTWASARSPPVTGRSERRFNNPMVILWKSACAICPRSGAVSVV